MSSPPRKTAYVPATYGLIHAIVDASCVMAVFSAVYVHRLPSSKAFYLVLGYDLLAFATQFVFGWFTDKLRAPRVAIFAGLISTALAIVAVRVDPLATMIAAGVGNSLFHIGAGAFSLYANFGRASVAGIYVAPGALGLAVGTWTGKTGNATVWPFLLALLLSLLVATFIRNPVIPYREKAADVKFDNAALIVVLLLFSVAMRSLIGFSGCFDCPKTQLVSLGLPLVAFGGKALGGIISDRFGWMQVSVGALVLSAPLIAFGSHYPIVIVTGMLLFQMTMPVTLVATARIFPRKPAFAFGLPCVALILGAVPTFYRPFKLYYNHYAFFALILTSAAALYFALKLFGGKIPMAFPPKTASENDELLGRVPPNVSVTG